MPTGAFNICCPRDYVSRHNGGTSGAPLKQLRDDSALIVEVRGIIIEDELNIHIAVKIQSVPCHHP